jgi:hypothetical protein
VLTTYLDLLVLACVALFVFAIWPPLVLLVVALAAGLLSWRLSGSPMPERRERKP